MSRVVYGRGNDSVGTRLLPAPLASFPRKRESSSRERPSHKIG